MYALARLEQRTEEKAFRVYVSDSLFFQGHGKTTDIRFDDWLHPQPEDTRTAEEIIDSIKRGINV